MGQCLILLFIKESHKPDSHIKIMQSTELLITSAIAGLSVLFILVLIFKKSGKQIPPLPPGPKGLPLLGNLLSLDPELHVYFSNLTQKYGPIYTIKLGKKIGIVITSPALAKEVLKDQDITFANRDVPVAGRELTYGGRDIAWTPYGPELNMLRKVCVREMLSNKTLDGSYVLRRKELRQMMKYLYENRGEPVNIGEQMFLTILNVITGMMWGGTVKGGEREGIGSEFKKIVGEMTALLGMPNLSDFYPGLARFDLQGIRKKMRVLAKKFDKIFETIIEKRLKSGSESKDFLQVLLELIDEGDAKTKFTMIHLKALLTDMLVAATDTTSNMIEFALAEMMNNPEVLNKVQQELDSVIGKNNIIEETDINKLLYLHAVMKETLRLHPALPVLIPHSPSETCQVAGYTIPKGARVFVNVWAIHRDPSIWENPLQFSPERFLDGKRDYSGNDFNYFPFGSGRRICAGVAMGERMFMYSLSSLVHSFEWSVPDGEKLEVSEKFGIVLKKRTPLVAIPTPRLSNHSLYQ